MPIGAPGASATGTDPVVPIGKVAHKIGTAPKIVYSTLMAINQTQMTTTSTKVSLFRAGFKAEEFWGDVITAHHMNTRSVYRLKKNSDVSITHTATYEGDDIFTVSVTEVTAYHPSGNVLSSTTKTLGVYDNFLDAYYRAEDIAN